MPLPMNNGPPITTDGALAQQEAPPLRAEERAIVPEVGAPDEVPTIAQPPETASASVSLASSETTVALPPATSGIGVLIVNLGTPDAPTPTAVRRYLKEFLTDRRVIEKNSPHWKAFLNAVILPLRSRRRARDYEKIWNRDKDESPIKTITRSQAEKLGGILEPLGKHVIVDWAMRYGNPSLASRLEVLVTWGCERILVMPLYPQYSAATTATACDEVFRFLMRQRRQPALRFLPPYYEDPYYIEVLASTMQAELKSMPFTPDVILASYHGMPKEAVDKGDPYLVQCARTTELLREQLGLDETKLMMSFQSRFGRAQWLEPHTLPPAGGLGGKGGQ